MSRLPALLRRLSRDRRGAATIEFALWSMLFFMGMLTALDFAMWRTQQLRLGSAIEQGGILAFNGRAGFNDAARTQLETYLRSAAQVTGAAQPTIAVTCNNGVNPCTESSRQCVCLSTGANGVNSFTPPSSGNCGAACSGNTTAGYYVTIRASNVYGAAILPDSLLAGRTMADSVVVRLQ